MFDVENQSVQLAAFAKFLMNEIQNLLTSSFRKISYGREPELLNITFAQDSLLMRTKALKQ
jgi:hypothetical protein